MKWHAQVVHIVRKDLFLSRWLLLAYVAVVLGATAVAAGWLAAGTNFYPLWSLSLVLLGMVLFALLVQADSPQRTDAFWITLPFSRSAMFAAKVAGAVLLLLVVPLLGQFAALLAHAVPRVDIPRMLFSSTLAFGAWLGLAAVIAALTRDLRTFIVALTLVMLGWFVGMQVLGAFLSSGSTEESPSRFLVPAIVVGGSLFVLAYLYRTRNVRRGAWIAILLGCATVVLPLAASRSTPAETAVLGSIPEPLRPAALSVKDFRLQANGRATLGLELSGASASHQYLLVSPTGHLEMPDGSSVQVEIQGGEGAYLPLNDPVPHPGEGLVWLGERTFHRGGVTGVQIVFSPGQRAALAGGDARLTVRGRLEVREARVRGELPLETGATGAFDGRRLRVLEVGRFEGGPAVELQISSVSSSRSAGAGSPWSRPPGRPTSHALVNHEAGEAIALTEMGSSGGSFGLVLPGNETWTTTKTLQPGPGISEVRIAGDWLRHARLLIMDWVPVGSDPVQIQTTVQGTDPQRRGR
jgi:ABC-type transport system involved in multi-copper enzyme maturation permease subunit